jgi:hypothetical protein
MPPRALNYSRTLTALLAVAAIARAASAQSDSPWDGVYVGVNAGEASRSTCNSWALNGAIIGPSVAFEFNNR